MTQNDADTHIQFDSIIDNLSQFKNQISLIQQQIRAIEKKIQKQVNILQNDATKRANKVPRKPSGFAKPTKVTKELCEFMNKEEGTEIARTDVTKALVMYIKQNKLENKQNNIAYELQELKNNFKLHILENNRLYRLH